jgi:hypothetical protein
MLSQDQMQALKTPSPPEALRHDTSRGVELNGIKTAQAPAVAERLNDEVFVPCGIGWRYTHSPFEGLHIDNGRAGVSPGSPSSTGSTPTTIVLAVTKWYGTLRLTGESSATVARTTTGEG